MVLCALKLLGCCYGVAEVKGFVCIWVARILWFVARTLLCSMQFKRVVMIMIARVVWEVSTELLCSC